MINPKRSFITHFTTEITKVTDGVAFVVRGQGAKALGAAGGGIGYGKRPGDSTPAIAPSLAVELDTWDNSRDGFDPPGQQHIAATTDGDITRHLIWRTPGFSMYGDRQVSVTIVYNAQAHRLAVHATQRVNSDATLLGVQKVRVQKVRVAPLFTLPIDLDRVVDSDKAYVGFTGGTGLTTVTDPQESILMWTFDQD